MQISNRMFISFNIKYSFDLYTVKHIRFARIYVTIRAYYFTENTCIKVTRAKSPSKHHIRQVHLPIKNDAAYVIFQILRTFAYVVEIFIAQEKKIITNLKARAGAKFYSDYF